MQLIKRANTPTLPKPFCGCKRVQYFSPVKMSSAFPFPPKLIVKDFSVKKKMETKQLDEQQCAPQDIQVQANHFTSRVR